MSTDQARRSTKQRSAVKACLDAAAGFQTAQQIHEHLRSQGEKIGLATVYRALQAMAEDGEADQLRTGLGEVAYRRCSTGHHHHHLVCRSCSVTVELSATQIEAWIDEVSTANGFTEVDHSVELVGLCAACRASRPNS